MNSKTNNQFPNEKVIDVKELCWRLLEQWRMIVVVAIVVAIMFLGYKHLQNARDAQNKAQNEVNTFTAEEILNTLAEDDRQVVAGAYRLLIERELLAKHIQNAPLMQLDPTHVDRLRLSWTVDIDEKNQKSLIQAYATALQAEECINTIIECSGVKWDSAQASDLLSIKYPSEKGQDIVCCDVYLTDDVDVELIQEKLRQLIDSIHNNLQEEYGPHKIIDLKNELVTVSDETVLQKQTTVLNSFANCNNQITSLKTTFSADQRDAFSKLEAINKRQRVDDQDNTTDRAITIRNFLVGGFLGIILYCLGFLLYVIVSNRVFYASAIPTTVLRRLGEWHSDCSGLKGKTLIRDQFILKKHHKTHLDKENETKKIVGSINRISKQKGFRKLLFVSTGQRSKKQKDFIKAIIEQCSLNNIDVDLKEIKSKDYGVEDDLLINADGVVLVLIQNRSTYKDIEYVFNRCFDYDKPLIGSVYLD